MIACSCLASALLAVGGMTNGVQIARTPVTNAEYAEFRTSLLEERHLPERQGQASRGVGLVR